MRLRRTIRSALLIAAMAFLCFTTFGKPPPNSNSYGDSLQGWMKIYWTWWQTGGDPAGGQVGKVVLLPLPAGELTGGTGTAEDPYVFTGHLDVTIRTGSPFVLPIVAWIGEMYTDGSVDPPADDARFGVEGGITGEAWVDGRPVITEDNVKDFYVPYTPFDEPVMYDHPTDYGAIGAVYTQSIGFVNNPLSKGTHEVQVSSTFIVPEFNIFVAYENTWTITVK